MEYLVCYDIVEDDIRKSVADICLNKGLARIQYSVFYGDLSRNRAEEVLMEIKDEIKGNEAIIFMVELCEKCSKRKKMVVENKKKIKKDEKDELKELKEERISKEQNETAKEKGNESEKEEQSDREKKEITTKKRKKRTRISKEYMKTLEEKGVVVL